MIGRPVALVAMLLAVSFAGCVTPAFLGRTSTPSGTNQSVNYTAIEQAIGDPIVADHNHLDGSLHMASYNLLKVANVTGNNGAPPDQETYAETCVKNGYAYLTRYGPNSGLVIFDVHDIEHPKFVSFIHLDAGFEPDVDVSDDGHWAFWETQRFPTSEETPVVDNPGGNLVHGVQIIDISDKAHPRWAGYYPVAPDGPHSLRYANISGRTIVFLSVYAYAYAYYQVEVPTTQRLIITELQTTGPVATLKTLAEYRQPGATGGPGLFPHDVSVSYDNLTHQYLAYVAYWNVGMVILNVTDPANPQEVSQFTNFGPATYRDVHMARPFPNLIDGRQITVVEPEVGGENNTGYVTFVDTTDPVHPRYVSSWILPGNLSSQGLTFSPHYFDVSPDGKVAMANYHAGVWVIDVHNRDNLLHPKTVAFNELGSDRVAHDIFGQASSGAFDAWWYHGHVVAGDFLQGLDVLRYTGP